MLLKHVLNDEIANSHQYEDMRAKLQSEDEIIRAAGENFGVEATAQLQQLAEVLVGSKGAIILYDEMATLAPGCADLAVDLQILAVLTDNVTRAGSGVGPLFEDANSLGARDMGLLPDTLPGYEPTTEKGLAYDEILNSPDIKALFVMGANPLRHVKQLPSNLEFLIVQDIQLTETAELADVVLPTVTFAEKDGSMTNVDHHVQAIRHALRPLPGAKPDWEILVEIAKYLGQKWTYTRPQDILLEIAASNPFYSGLTWERLGAQGVRTQEQLELNDAGVAIRKGAAHA
jgi:NADH-quinone oxidoreductase subunit G